MPLTGAPLEKAVDISNLLRSGLDRHSDDAALVSAEMRWTWRELDEITNRLAANLLVLGLEPGDRVATLMPNRTALLIFYIACFKAGFVITPLNYRYTAREIDYALELSGAVILFSHVEREADWQASKYVGKLPHGIVTYGGTRESMLRYEAAIAAGSEGVSMPRRDPAEPAAIFFTSGSTGKPKGVTHTVASLGFMLASAVSAFEMVPGDVVLPGSSMSHIGSFVWALAGLSCGARVVVARTFDGGEILPLLRAERPTVVCMVPSALLRLVREHDASRADFASIRVCRCGSDTVSPELEAEFESLAGFPLDDGYGMSEVGLATLNPPSGPIKHSSIGTANPGFTLSIRDESGVEVANGTSGNLFMAAPSLAAGYWQNPEATAEAICDGWIDSGDVLSVDDDGYFWFRGRKKQIIIHDSSNIYPQEVEAILLEHPAVESAGVVGVHDLFHGENVRAYISLREGVDRPLSDEIIAFARERIGYKAPEQIEVLDEIPLNPTGKVDRVALKARASAHH